VSDIVQNCNISCQNDSHLCITDSYYEAIVSTLQHVSYSVIPCVPLRSLKPFWNELHRVSKNCANLFFLSELCQISTNFDIFLQKDGKETKIMRDALIFYLT